MPPRKKLFEAGAAAPESSPETPESAKESPDPQPAEPAKPKRTPRTRRKLDEAPALEAEAEPEAPPKRRTRKAAEPGAVPRPAPASRRRKAAAPEPEPTAAPAEPEAPEEPAGFLRRRRPVQAEAEPKPEPAPEAPAKPKPVRSRRRPAADEAAAEAQPERAAEPEAEELTIKVRRRPARKPEPPAPVEDAEGDLDETLDLVLMPTFRAIGSGPAEEEGQDLASIEDDGEQALSIEPYDPDQPAEDFGVLLAPQWRSDRDRSRGRGRGRKPRRAEASEEQAAPEPPAPAAPEPVRLEPVAVPADAPQVIRHEGQPVLIVGGKVIPALICEGSIASPRGLAAFQEQGRLAAEHGVRIFRFEVPITDRDGSGEAALQMVRDFMGQADAFGPDGLFLIRTRISAVAGAEGYERSQNPKGAPENTRPSLSDDDFWGRIHAALKTMASALPEAAPRVIGVHLDYGSWVHHEGEAIDRSPAATEEFRMWLADRYSRDRVSLRASWFDGAADFDSAEIPGDDALSDEAGFVRTERKSRRWVDYNLFLSDSTSLRIARLCRTVNESSGGRLMCGADYGWTLEWSHPTSGHLALGKLLRCPDVDFVSGPPSEESRGQGGIGAFPTPIDSCALNGKLHFCEQAYPTSISGSGDASGPVIKTPQALDAVHWRDAGSVLAHSGGLVWSDRDGQGWLASRGIWERAGQVQKALQWRLAAPQAAPDLAVLIDERSLAYLADERAFITLIDSVQEAVMRSGISAGFYLLSDLAHRENFPDCKAALFVNAWDMRPEVRSAVKTRLQRDGKVVAWLYCAGIFEAGRESLERVREATGIALRLQPFNAKPGTVILNMRDPLSRSLPADQMRQGGGLEPSFFAIPEDATVLGEYAGTGLPSFVVKKFEEGGPEERWTSVFLGEPIVTPGFIRALGEMAGAHVWDHDDDVIHVRAPFLSVHCSGAGNRTITLPDKWSAYSIQARDWAPVEGNSLRFLAMDGSTHVFLVGHRSEIEAILNSPSEMRLTEEEIMARKDDTVHWDAMQLEVPIMKLDEWVEESWGEELADDLLLKPSLLEVEAEEPEPESDSQPRKRRRKRDGRRGSRGGRESGGTESAGSSSGDGLGFNFRRR